jgi:hypothetical protein
MSTVTKKRPRVKPARSIRLELAPFGSNTGVVKITVGPESANYLLMPLPSDFGTAYRLLKDESGERYDVLLDGEGGSCECKGFARWHRCKHRDGLLALRQAGRL